MGFLTKIYDVIFSNAMSVSEITSISDLNNFLTITNDILVIFGWIKLFLPMDIIRILVVLTSIYYFTRFTWASIKIVRSGIIGNNSFLTMFTGGNK
jgi:hypothetical protein